MEEGTFLLVVLVIVILAIATFSWGGIRSSDPLANPPNPNAEFGVIHEKGLRGATPPPAAPIEPTPPPPASSQPPEKLLEKHVRLSAGNTRVNKPDQEYVRVTYSLGAPKEAPETINLSGWTIGNARGESLKLGSATRFPGVSTTENQDQLILKKGGRVNIVSGRSPTGSSFQANKCTAYFSQHHTFVPSLPGGCPVPSREPGQDNFSDRCFQFVRTLNSCRTPSTLPLDLDNSCREYINRTATYSGCIANHRYDKDFYLDEWWVYLNRPTHIWSDIRETAELRNEAGVLIASFSY